MDGEDRTLSDVLSFITSFDIIISDKYPKQICYECYVMIRKTDEFKKLCIQSETLLKNEFLNSNVFVDDFMKQDLIPNSSTSLPFHTLMLNENSLLNIKQVSPQSADYEIPLIENIDYSVNNATDTLKIDGLNIIKEERDDFLQEDIEDLANSILIDKIQLPEISPLVCVPKADVCECGGRCEGEGELKCQLKDCKLEENIDNKITNICFKCKDEFTSLDLLKAHIDTHKNDNTSNFDQNLTNCFTNYDNDTECGQLDYFSSNDDSAPTKIFVRDSTTTQIRNEKTDNKIKQETDRKENFADTKFLAICCTKCTFVLHDIKAFEKHMERHEKNEKKKKFVCSMCACKFMTRNQLIKHIRTHEERDEPTYMCTTCKREFKHQAHLENHIETAHTKLKGYKCDKCTKSFSNQESLDYHKQQHTVSRKYQCNVCSKTFAIHSVLNEHLRTHTGEKPFLCSICGRGFTQKTNLAQHMRRHQGLKPYKCGSCDRSFVSKGELDAHTRKHTGKHPFVCDECGNSFTTSSSLTKHRRIHTGEKRYACDLCAMRFTALGTLKNHRRTHTGEKPYQCSLCEKAFIQRQDLVGHIRCHTGERPFTCTSCGQGFRKSAALKVHLRSHSNDMLVM